MQYMCRLCIVCIYSAVWSVKNRSFGTATSVFTHMHYIYYMYRYNWLAQQTGKGQTALHQPQVITNPLTGKLNLGIKGLHRSM